MCKIFTTTQHIPFQNIVQLLTSFSSRFISSFGMLDEDFFIVSRAWKHKGNALRYIM